MGISGDIMLNVLVFGMATSLVLCVVGGPFDGAVSAFLLAGIVPGINVQLPWYSMVLAAPVLLYGLYKFTRLHFPAQRSTKVVLDAKAKKRAAKPVVASRKIAAKKSAAQARKAYAKAKRKPAKSLVSRKLTQSKA